MPGLALSVFGTLLLAVGLWRSGQVGRLWPALLAAGVVLGAIAPFGLIGFVLSTATYSTATLVIGGRAATSGRG